MDIAVEMGRIDETGDMLCWISFSHIFREPQSVRLQVMFGYL